MLNQARLPDGQVQHDSCVTSVISKNSLFCTTTFQNNTQEMCKLWIMVVNKRSLGIYFEFIQQKKHVKIMGTQKKV
jgi:hypothetical protein